MTFIKHKALFPSLLFMPADGVNPEKANIGNWQKKLIIGKGLGRDIDVTAFRFKGGAPEVIERCKTSCHRGFFV